METDELIKKCSAITLEDEEEDKIIFGGNMKEKMSLDCGRLLDGQNPYYKKYQS